MNIQSKKKTSDAFTLVEIMVVVVILGILAATIIPQFIGTTQDAKISAAKSQIAELESAVERFYVHMDRRTLDGFVELWRNILPKSFQKRIEGSDLEKNGYDGEVAV